MGFFRNKVTRRSSVLGLLSDLALIGAAANRAIQRRGDSGSAKASVTELTLAGGAAFRLLQRMRRRRKARKLAKLSA